MRRREFLKSAGCFIVSASSGALFGCGSDSTPGPADAGTKSAPKGSFSFPQGVASADPRSTSVMLWTRLEPKDKPKMNAHIALRVEVASDEAFTKLVVHKDISTSDASDFTVRVLVEDLQPDTIYYYRFVASQDESTVGRTWTAPKPDADTKIRFAWTSCQDYSAGFYGAWRRMVNDDVAASADERLRFVMFIGDFIYETRAESFQMPVDDNLQNVGLTDRSGMMRQVPEFPSGTSMQPDGGTGIQYARTLEDYRLLYKTFLSDPDLQAARARFPFVSVWDDHEFTNDCWQTQANYTDESSFDEPSQQRRVAANQAWFEYVPAILTGAEKLDGVDVAAHDFKFAEVTDTPYDTPVEVTDADNAKALGTITIYRVLRFGKNVDLVLTDNRAYRSDHAIPEDVTFGNPLVFDPRAALPLAAVNAFDAGRTANGGNPEDQIGAFMNTRKDSPPSTFLGDTQKAWWKQVMMNSQASFKVWGNSVPLLRFKLDTTNIPIFPEPLVLSTDAWDGYPTERRELMQHLKDNNILNMVSLSGDHHAFFAGLVYDDFDADNPTPVAVDFCGAGISSTSQFAAVASAVKAKVTPTTKGFVQPVLDVITYDATPLGGSDKAVVNMNTLILYGSPAAMAAAATNDPAMALAARNPAINPHLRYADSSANGYGLAAFDGQGGQVTLVTIERPIVDRGEDGAMVVRRADFQVPHVSSLDQLSLDEPTISGTKPFPLT